MATKYAFSGSDGIVPVGITLATGTLPRGNAGRIIENSWGLVRLETGQAELTAVVSGPTHSGTFYTRGVKGTMTYPINLVQINDIKIRLFSATTFQILSVNAVVASQTITTLVDGKVNEISWAIDLANNSTKAIINGETELSITTGGTDNDTASSVIITGMRSDSGSVLMDVHISDGFSYPDFIQCTSQAKTSIGTESDMVVNGTISAQQSFVNFPQGFSFEPICAGYSPFQHQLFYMLNAVYRVYDLETKSFNPVGGVLTPLHVNAIAGGYKKTAVYVPFNNRIYYQTNHIGVIPKFAYLECGDPTTHVDTTLACGVLNNFSYMTYCAYDEKIYSISSNPNENTLHVLDLATETTTTIDIPDGAGNRNILAVQYCPKNHNLYIVVRDDGNNNDCEMVKIDLKNAPTTVVNVITTSMGNLTNALGVMVYNHYENTMYIIRRDTLLDGPVRFDCSDETYDDTILTDSLISGDGAVLPQLLNESSGGITSFVDTDTKTETILDGAIDTSLNYNTVTISRRTGGCYVPSTNSIFRGTKTAQHEYTIPSSSKLNSITNESDGGSVISSVVGDKISINTTQDISADSTPTRKIIGVNVNTKGISSQDGSKMQLSMKDNAGEIKLGPEIVLNPTPQDFVQTSFTNSQGAAISVADINALEPTVEAR